MNDPPQAQSGQPRGAEPDPTATDHQLSIGDLAREFDISTRTIRFYEQRGLLRPQRRGLVRTFCSLDRQRLALIVRAKNLGLSLEEIAEHLALFDLPASPGADLAELKGNAERQIALLNSKRADVGRALADLRRISSDIARRLSEARPAKR